MREYKTLRGDGAFDCCRLPSRLGQTYKHDDARCSRLTLSTSVATRQCLKASFDFPFGCRAKPSPLLSLLPRLTLSTSVATRPSSSKLGSALAAPSVERFCVLGVEKDLSGIKIARKK